ncbi:membrane protein insertase YidC [bacterium]|nr:membrane protein insertase YidC [bacterium]
MDRNFLLAFLLSTLAIFGYYTFFPPDGPKTENEQKIESVQTAETGEEIQSVKTIAEPESQEPMVGGSESLPRKNVKIDSDLYSIEIDSQNGSLSSFILNKYKYSTESHFSVTKFFFSLFSGKEEEQVPYDPNRMVNMAGDVSEKNSIWKLQLGPEESNVNYQVSAEKINVTSFPETLELKTKLASGLEIRKILTFHPDSYKIDMEIKAVNRTGVEQTINPRINFGAGGEAITGETLPQPKVAVTFIDEDFEKHDGGDVENVLSFNNSLWAGLMDKYFISIAKTVDGTLFNGTLKPMDSILDSKSVVVPQLFYTDDPIRLENNQEYNRKFQLYIGPKVESRLERFDYYLPQAMDLGWFEILARPLLSLLRWLQGYVVNWGIAIIILTIIVRAAMFPLAFKGMISMRKMQALSPKITALREKYKGNKEKLNQEIMKFYSQNKVNPMGGCLPMVLQIPIFIALYQALLPAIELRHTPFFLFWSDLSANDYTLILPILMGASMFFQQSLTPTPTMDPTQAKVMKWMPVMMVLFFLNMPSGLVLYWVISNIISVGQQLIINHVLPPAQVSTDIKAKGKAKADTAKKGKGSKVKK